MFGKAKTMSRMGECIPEELIEDMLLRTSVKDLLCFRAVCKAWKSLIDSPSFKLKHFEVSKRSLLLFEAFHRRWPTIRLYTHESFKHNSLPRETITFVGSTCSSFRMPIWDQGARVCWFGVARGLLCFAYEWEVIVCNPSTRDFRRINYSPTPSWANRFLFDNFMTFAFGFDPASQDYKFMYSRYNTNGTWSLWLFSLRSECWKLSMINAPLVEELLCDCYDIDGHLSLGDGYLDGKFYWFAKNGKMADGSSGPALLVFDFSTETFKTAPLSEGLANARQGVAMTTRGCVELIATFHEDNKKWCELWVMKEDESWFRKLSVLFMDRMLNYVKEIPRGITEDGLIILRANIYDQAGNMFVLNPTTGSLSFLTHVLGDFRFFNYVESLFSTKL